jgi:hypothetical protein
MGEGGAQIIGGGIIIPLLFYRSSFPFPRLDQSRNKRKETTKDTVILLNGALSLIFYS